MRVIAWNGACLYRSDLGGITRQALHPFNTELKGPGQSGSPRRGCASEQNELMIVPIVDEETWRARLDGLPPWQPPLVPTLVVSPHPDDETLATGGLIAFLRARDVPVTVAAVTDGENCYEGETEMGRVRTGEQERALLRLGVSPECVLRFRMTDSDVGSEEERLAGRLAALLSPGMHVVAPWTGDFHPDHEACGRAARAAARAQGALLTECLFWTWHRGTPELLEGMRVGRFLLDPEQRRAKHEALQCHGSQLHREGDEPILPEYLLGPAYRPYEVFLLA